MNFEWLTKIWPTLKSVGQAFVIFMAYFLGKRDEYINADNAQKTEALKEANRVMEKREKIRDKYRKARAGARDSDAWMRRKK